MNAKRLIVTLATLLVAMQSAARAADVQWDHKKGESLSCTVDGQTLWSYHFSAKDNVPYIHPLSVPGGQKNKMLSARSM